MFESGTLLSVLVGLAGCASSADEIAPSYVSPVQYENYTCQQLAEEAQRVSERASAAAGIQDQARTNDAVMTTVGVVIFWPSLFFLKGNGPQAAELASLKGQMEAVEQASIRKNCGIQFQRQAPPAATPNTGTPGNNSLRKQN